jgi:ketosteroid isomerase-like protein
VAERDIEQLEAKFEAALAAADTGPALEVAREVYDRIADEGPESVVPLLHPEFELHLETLVLDGRVYRGPEGFLEWRREMDELFEGERFDPLAVRMVDDSRYAILGRLILRGRASGVELDVPLVHVFEQRDGKVFRQAIYSDTSEALASIGISESDS